MVLDLCFRPARSRKRRVIMFGNLFEEESEVASVKESDIFPSLARVSHDVKTVDIARCHRTNAVVPPPPRQTCALSGIENQGATCYLNSLLQTLLFTPEFREGLFRLTEEDLGLKDSGKNCDAKVRVIPLQLQRLFVTLLFADQQAASTTDLTESFGWTNNEELQQHDVQELNRILFSAIETSLVGTSGKDLISFLYRGTAVNQISCQACGKVSERQEDFLDLNIIVSGYNSLEDSLNASYVHKEVMKGKNQYHCSVCNKLVDAKKGAKIRALPPVLTFSLSRFSYDYVKGERYKETGKFAFPMVIDMTPFCEKSLKSEDATYELFSVVIHSGSSYGGHYHAYIRDIDGLGNWVPPEEESYHSREDAPNLGNEIVEVEGPVQAIKAILSNHRDGLSVDLLCVEIQKQTGLSWNKRFKRSYGPISKFLIKHDDVFYFNQSTQLVYLKELGKLKSSKQDGDGVMPNCTSSIQNCAQDEITKSSIVKRDSSESPQGSPNLSSLGRKRCSMQSSKIGHNWFDFNDARVTPIHYSDIEKQFSGKESAYMLFYRRKSLRRHVEVQGCPRTMVPAHLLQWVDKQNEILLNCRCEHEAALNSILVQIHFGVNHQYVHGALQPIEGTLSVIDLIIDCRKTLADLIRQIVELGSELCPCSDFSIHIARELPAGLHLYEELSRAQADQVLKDIGVQEGTHLFVWDGVQVQGETVPVGVASEPILLTITCVMQDNEPQVLMQGFAKNMTLGELRILLHELCPLSLEDLVIVKVQQTMDCTKAAPLEHQQDGKSLNELGLMDGDCLCAESKISKTKSHTNGPWTQNQQIRLIVQNRCGVYGDLAAFQCPEVTLDVNLKLSLRDLKLQVIMALNLDKDKQYRLRKILESLGKKLPMHDDHTLQQAGLLTGSQLLIEEGEAPLTHQITLMFSIGSAVGDIPDFEITVDKSMTVSRCRHDMVHMAGLEGDAWHLSKTNWCGEITEPLSDDNATLESENLQHGDSLVIQEGRLPPRGFLALAIWLHPTPGNLADATARSASVEALVHAAKALWQTVFMSCPEGNEDGHPLRLGEVELSSESTLAELKRQVLTLPGLSSVSLPGVRYLRLRLLEDTRPTRVLRGLSCTLRKLKLVNHQELCAQLLLSEEDLLQSHILLNVCQRIPNTRIYAPALELVWDSGKSATPRSLRQTIAEQMGIPPERTVVAKHFHDMCLWRVIDESGGQYYKYKGNKKKWSRGKLNLRHTPYFLKDGDTIGVKDLMDNPGIKDDFSTPEDDERREQARLAEEEEKQRCRQKEEANSSGDCILVGGSEQPHGERRGRRQPEVGITIHVQDFS